MCLHQDAGSQRAERIWAIQAIQYVLYLSTHRQGEEYTKVYDQDRPEYRDIKRFRKCRKEGEYGRARS